MPIPESSGRLAESGPDRRWLVLAICCMSLLIVGMDSTIVNVALPSIQVELDSSVSGLQWAVASYTMVLASLLILSGSTADRLGRVRVFQVGLLIFTLASVGCSLAPGIGWLIGFRVLQGIGASMLNPVAMSIIRNVFDDPRERAQAIGLWGAVFGLSLALGPVLGGALTELSWRAVFLVNVPIGLAAIFLTMAFVPESRAERPRRIDPVGQALAFVLLASVTWTLIEGPNLGWGSAWMLAGSAVAAVALVSFIRHELGRDEPLIELRFFGSRPFAGATAIAVVSFAAVAGVRVVNTHNQQESRGLSPVEAGLSILPMAVATMLVSPISGRFIGARGVRRPLVFGGIGIGAGGLMLVPLTADTSLIWLLLAYTVFGAGFGAINPPITNTAVSGMPASQAGVAAAVASSSRMVGQTLGVAVIGGIATAGATGSIGEHLASAGQATWWLVVGLAAGVVALGLASSSAAALESARRTAERFQAGDPHLREPVIERVAGPAAGGR